MLVQPYLDFNGKCEEAIEFYKKAIGAQVESLMRFKESPDPGSCAPGSEEKVMHACLRVGDSQIMASDGWCKGKTNFEGINLTITADDVAQAKRQFEALATGGQVLMPLSETFFAKIFGMTTDRFGVSWMVIVKKPM